MPAGRLRPSPPRAVRTARAMSLPLHTPRLVLRRFAADDLDAIGAVFGDPEVMRYVGSRRAPWTSEEVGDALDRVEAHWREHGFGPLAVVEQAAGVVTGSAACSSSRTGPTSSWRTRWPVAPGVAATPPRRPQPC